MAEVTYGETAPGTSVQGPMTVGASCSTPPVQVMVIVLPERVMLSNPTGGLIIVTRKLQPLTLPQASVATQLTVLVVPVANRLHDGGLHVTVTFVLQVSVAITV